MERKALLAAKKKPPFGGRLPFNHIKFTFMTKIVRLNVRQIERYLGFNILSWINLLVLDVNGRVPIIS